MSALAVFLVEATMITGTYLRISLAFSSILANHPPLSGCDDVCILSGLVSFNPSLWENYAASAKDFLYTLSLVIAKGWSTEANE